MADQWETVAVFEPPSPVTAYRWTRKELKNEYEPPVPYEPLDVYAMLVQRTREGKSRIVPSAIDRHGVITVIEPGSSGTHITFILPRGEELSDEDKAVLSKWWGEKPPRTEDFV